VRIPRIFLPGLLCLLACLAGCNTGENGGPPEDKPAPPESREDAALRAYSALRQDILEGNFIALFDACSGAYREKKFASDTFRKSLASNPGLQTLELTAEDVARMKPRDLAETFFRLLPVEHKKRVAQAMAAVKITARNRLPDGRVEIVIETDGAPSKLFWVQEGDAWKMDGEEAARAPEGK
jgi:hypothetical protein